MPHASCFKKISFWLLTTGFWLLSPLPAHADAKLLLTPLPLKNLDALQTKNFIHNLAEVLKQKKVSLVVDDTLQSPVFSFLAGVLDQARDQVLNLQNDEAILTIRQGLNALKRKSPSLDDLKLLADASLLLAYCQKNKGDTQAMQISLEEAARLNPHLMPSERDFPPSLIAEFDKARERVWNGGQFSQLTVQTEPEGARIFVNGVYKGNAPLRLDRYPVGEHYLYASTDEKQVFEKVILKMDASPLIKMHLNGTKTTITREIFFSSGDYATQKKWLTKMKESHGAGYALGIGITGTKNKLNLTLTPQGFTSLKPVSSPLDNADTLEGLAVTIKDGM